LPHHAFLEDPLAPMRSLAPSPRPHAPTRLSYSSSSGSSRSRSDLADSGRSRRDSERSRMDVSSDGRRSGSDGSTLNLTLDVPTRKLLKKDSNSTLDYPNLKTSSQFLGGHIFTSPPKKIHRSGVHKADSSSSRNLNSIHEGERQPKAANRALHGVFSSRLRGPLASLQPLDSVFRPRSARARKKRSLGGSVTFQNTDKENIDIQLNSPDELYQTLGPGILQQLTTKPSDSFQPHLMAPDDGSFGFNESDEPNQSSPARKASGMWRALAERLHAAISHRSLDGASSSSRPSSPFRDSITPPPSFSSASNSPTRPRTFSTSSSPHDVGTCGTADPPAVKRMVRAMYSYKAAQKGDLSLTADEEYEVLEETEEHWWRLRDSRGNEGFSPSNYVKDATNIGLHQYDWYLGDATRQRAEAMLLREEREGCFLVRNSSSGSGAFTISVYAANVRPQVKHYHIQKDAEGRFYLSQNIKCASIPELIYKHQYNPGGLCTRLRSAPHGNKPPTTAGFGRDKWDIPLSEITLLEEIGSGQFGVVRRGKYRNNDVAVKMMKEGTMSEDEFIEEAKVMTKLQHPNLVQLYGVCKRQRPVYIITEYLEYGSLLHYLRAQEKHLSNKPDSLIDMCLQISEGMAYLEKEKFIHRDLAARNCLVGSANIKVGDFGLARYVVDDEYTGSGGAKFPIKWAAPEVLNYMRFSSKSDVWAFGVLMWEVFTCGKMPYGRRKNADVVAMVQEGRVLERPRHCPAPVYGVMAGCWASQQEDRPAFGELVSRIRELTDQDLADDRSS